MIALEDMSVEDEGVVGLSHAARFITQIAGVSLPL